MSTLKFKSGLPYTRSLLLRFKFITRKEDPLDAILTMGALARDKQVDKLRQFATVPLEDVLAGMTEKELAALRKRVQKTLQDG